MKVITGFGLLLALFCIGVNIGCRETAMPFETIDAIGVLDRADLHGQIGHLIRVESTPMGSTPGNDNGRSGGTTTVFDKDISDAPYYLQWKHTSVGTDDYLSTIADVLGRAESLMLVAELPQGVPFYEEVVLGKPNTTADRVTHCLKVTTADEVFYLGVHIVFTNTVKAWFARKLSQPLRIFFLEEKEDEALQLPLSLLPDVVRTTVVKDNDGTLTVSLQKEVVAAAPVFNNKEPLRLAAYSSDVLEPAAPIVPPAIVAFSAVSDNTNTAQAVTGNTVTITFTTNKPIVLQRSQLTFMPANGTHDRAIKAVAGADNRYTSDLRITNAMAVGMLRASVTLVDDDNNTSGAIVRDTGVTIAIDPTSAMVVAEAQTREKLRAWDEWVKSTIRPGDIGEKLAHWIFNTFPKDEFGEVGFTNKFGFEFEKTIITDLINLIVQEQPALAEQIRQEGLLLYPLSRNGIVYDYLLIQHTYPDAQEEEHYAHFRQLARMGGVRTRREGARDIVPVEEEYFWESRLFPKTTFFTPIERTEWKLKREDESIQGAIEEYRHTPPVKIVRNLLDGGIGFILIDLFAYYRQEQPAQAAVFDRDGVILHPISRNGLIYEWWLLLYRYPDKTEAERVLLFRQAARNGAIVVNKRTALTNVVPPGGEVLLPPSPESHISHAVRATEKKLREYDERVVNIGGGKDNPFFIFDFSDSTQHDLDNVFLQLFKVKIEFVFFDLWNIYKEEQPARAVVVERQGIILHPIGRNGLLYEWLWIRHEHSTQDAAAWLALFRQSARNGAIEVNRDGPTDIVPPEGAVYIRPPGENELVHQGLVLP